jgi:flagellar motility protein MotE (MotC chaperone)
MRSKVRWLLAVVIAVDLIVGAAFLAGGYSPTLARTSSKEEPEQTEQADQTGREEVIRDALRMLGEELSRRTRELERREAELAEILRGSEVLRRAGIDPAGADQDDAEEAAEARTEPVSQNEDFMRLQRAYENMEPESAALALTELADRDQEAVVELLLGWKPRTSGSILDAITQINSSLAADLSYEIWKRRGKSAP